MIKNLILILILILFSCKKQEVVSDIKTKKNIFENSSVNVVNGQEIHFELKNDGKYTLILFDSTINQIVSKEKFMGFTGFNSKKIYINNFNQKSLYLLLNNDNDLRIAKTLLILKK